MWLLPPDFPTNTFDLQPGSRALPWYADDAHAAALMWLLVRGEARISEWFPLPWTALTELDRDAPVREGAALVLLVPPDVAPEEIETQARSLPWPYVFWRSRRPALEGEEAWLERDIKRELLSQLRRSLLDRAHPLARFHVDRLPLPLVASMVADPVDLLEICQGTMLLALQSVADERERDDFEFYVRWSVGWRLGEYLLRIPEAQRQRAEALIYRGDREREDRASFRLGAQALQAVGLGLFVGEDLALGPLARSAQDETIWAAALHRLDLREVSVARVNLPHGARRTSKASAAPPRVTRSAPARSAPASLAGRARSLLIVPPIEGSERLDLTMMRDELSAWGFDCTVCAGDDATRDGVLGALRRLVDATEFHDVVVIYYSGLFGRARLSTANEPAEPMWDYIVPADHEPGRGFRGIAEFELDAFIDDLLPRTKNVTVIFDAESPSSTVSVDPESSAGKRYTTLIEGRRPSGHSMTGSDRVVRLAAAASSSAAYPVRRDEQATGIFTEELCAGLSRARRTPMSWDTLIREVRERIVMRRLSVAQRPELNGPRWRLPFSVREIVPTAERVTVVIATDGSPWLWAGRLHGIDAGDEVDILDDKVSITTTGRVIELFDDWAKLELDPSSSDSFPRPGSVGVLRSPSRHMTVFIAPEALKIVGLVSKLEQSGRLSVVERRADVDFEIILDEDELHVRGPSWMRRFPRPSMTLGVSELVEDLDAVARSELLLESLRDPPGLGPSSEWDVQVFGAAPSSRPRVLGSDELLDEGTVLHAEVSNPRLASRPIYVNMLRRDPSGRLALFNSSEPAGVEVFAREKRWIGRQRYRGLGLTLRWPSDVPQTEVGRETLTFVASDRPLDLRSLLEGPDMNNRSSQRTAQLVPRDLPSEPAASDELRSTVRRTMLASNPSDPWVTTLRWEVVSFSFEVTPST
ncbi:MAG: caspase family protein [Myxococcota bacterium]